MTYDELGQRPGTQSQGSNLTMDDWLEDFYSLACWVAIAVSAGAGFLGLIGVILAQNFFREHDPEYCFFLVLMIAFVLLILGVLTVSSSIHVGRHYKKRKKTTQPSGSE